MIFLIELSTNSSPFLASRGILKLWASGKGKKEISRIVGHDIKTVRKIIKNYENRAVSPAPSITCQC